ncbi:MAG: YlxR family protein [Eubacterium sp.]|nr:YlxR family protein [Eubacterium sp.]
MRRCIACMESKPQKELFRIVDDAGKICFDFDGNKTGRGAYLCKSSSCFALADKKRAFARAFKHNVSRENLDELKGEFDEKLQI